MGPLDNLQAYPLDLVRTRLAAQTSSNYYQGIAGTFATIVRDEGTAGLYRGLGPTLLQIAPNLAINYCAYETLRTFCTAESRDRGAPSVSFLCTLSVAAQHIPLHHKSVPSHYHNHHLLTFLQNVKYLAGWRSSMSVS